MAGRDLNKQQHELETAIETKGKKGDVFDKLGNEGVLQKIDEVKKQGGQDAKGTSLLDLAAEDVDQKQQNKPPEEAAKEAVEAKGKKSDEDEALAQKVVEEEKKVEQGPEGTKVDPKAAVPVVAVEEVAKEAETGKKPPKIDEAAKKLEQEKQAEEAAKKSAEDPLQKIAADKKSAGLRAREKVTSLVQQLTSNPVELQVLATATDPAQKATQLVEYVAQALGDRDLGALAAFGHEDLTEAMVVSPDARQQIRVMSPQALKMGAFAPILAQLVIDEVARQPQASAKNDEDQDAEQVQGDPRRLAPVLHRVNMRLRNPT